MYQRIAQPLSALVEMGQLRGAHVEAAIRRVLAPIPKHVPVLLACTHYPALMHTCEAVSVSYGLTQPLVWPSGSNHSMRTAVNSKSGQRATRAPPMAMLRRSLGLHPQRCVHYRSAFRRRLSEIRSPSDMRSVTTLESPHDSTPFPTGCVSSHLPRVGAEGQWVREYSVRESKNFIIVHVTAQIYPDGTCRCRGMTRSAYVHHYLGGVSGIGPNGRLRRLDSHSRSHLRVLPQRRCTPSTSQSRCAP